jgi:RHS repeat-associated protein
VVGYLHAQGIDQPLGVLKRYADVGTWKYVTPHANWRGEYSNGTFANGAECLTVSDECPHWPGFLRTGDRGELGPQPQTYPVWWGNLLSGRAEASGLQYLRNRYYDAKTGRFTQLDPIGLAGGVNLYGFADGDPVNFSDPFGLSPCPPCLAFADPEVVFSSVAASLRPSGPDWKVEVLFGLAAAMMAAADDGRADGSEIQQLRNSFGSRRAAFRAAKSDMGIARSAQPLRTTRVRDKHTGSLLRQHEFRNAKGEIVQIREDLPRVYPDGGRQGPHFNAGKAGTN